MPDTSPTLPDGTYLIWRGRTYPGSVWSSETALLLSPDAEEGFGPRQPGRGFQREVPLVEVEVQVLTTFATWRGRTFQVLGRSGDRVHLGYLGQDEEEATRLGLTKREPGVFTTTAPSAEVTGVRQERRPA